MCFMTMLAGWRRSAVRRWHSVTVHFRVGVWLARCCCGIPLDPRDLVVRNRLPAAFCVFLCAALACGQVLDAL